MARKFPHNFNGKLLNWPYCTKCGLILLKNKPTVKKARRSCTGTPDEKEK